MVYKKPSPKKDEARRLALEYLQRHCPAGARIQRRAVDVWRETAPACSSGYFVEAMHGLRWQDKRFELFAYQNVWYVAYTKEEL